MVKKLSYKLLRKTYGKINLFNEKKMHNVKVTNIT